MAPAVRRAEGPDSAGAPMSGCVGCDINSARGHAAMSSPLKWRVECRAETWPPTGIVLLLTMPVDLVQDRLSASGDSAIRTG